MLAILSAMPQELEAIRSLVESPTVWTIAGRQVTRGTLWGQEVIIAFSRWGKVAAAATAASILTAERVDKLVFGGIAGALRDDLRVGDVVVAKRLYQHDLDASPFFPATHIPLLNLSALPTDDTIAKELNAAAQVFLAEDFESTLGPMAERIGEGRRSVIADIATGDVIVASKEVRARVRRVVPTAACVEMEGAAVAQVCCEFSVPFGCLRVISDPADESVHQEDLLTMASIAGKYSAGILRRWLLG